MNDANYIEQVKSVLGSSDSKVTIVVRTGELELPKNANPLEVLIHGDSLELEEAAKYAQIHDPAHPSDEEIKDLQEQLAKAIIKKINKYLADWDSGNTYSYSFSFKATYGAFKNEQGDVEYVDIIKSDSTLNTVAEAIQAAKQWKTHLLERIVFYAEQEVGHKQISVKPIYTIRDTKLNHIASGTLEFDDERGVSTWLNQA